ncbi:HAMP domain-containing sensor histidine kinase [Ruminococcus sp. NK3A76]|uniref:sensor histidine kinase n=1 Tax=Ruminococcus sp. NK3A76 TaxID=877411 RepID=UPI00048E66A0|nr:HAMP domain-containing sensor histidine kinase [Ruminococcus sp. NK3A76]
MLWQALAAIIGLTAVIALLCVKIYLLKRSAREISKGFKEKLGSDTNALIGISSADRDMQKLTLSINEQLGEIRMRQIRFEQGDNELKTAITNISHDIRTPLTAINGYLRLLEKEDMSEDAAEYVRIIAERTDAMKALADELFEYSVIVSKKEDSEAEEVHINRLLEESITAMYAALTEKGITPEIDITKEKVVRFTDKQAIERIFTNILSNVIKYSEGDLSVIMDSSGRISFSNRASLTETEVEKLFDRFYTVTDARASTGLGLSIAKTLAARAGAKLSAELDNGRLTITLSV